MSSLMKLKNLIKVSTQLVMTTLGGKKNGYLGLVQDGIEHVSILGATIYVWSVLPRLILVAAVKGLVISAQKKHYYEQLWLFRDTNAVERVLIQQIVSAVDVKYLKALLNTRTKKMTSNISIILEHYFEN